MEKAKLK